MGTKTEKAAKAAKGAKNKSTPKVLGKKKPERLPLQPDEVIFGQKNEIVYARSIKRILNEFPVAKLIVPWRNADAFRYLLKALNTKNITIDFGAIRIEVESIDMNQLL